MIIGVVASAVCIGVGRYNEKKHTKDILEAVYTQCEMTAEAHIGFVEIMEDIVSYGKAYVEKPDWKNLNNYHIALTWALSALNEIPTDTLTLSDEQIDAANELGFDVASLLNFCDAELKSNKESNYGIALGRCFKIENFADVSEYESLKATLGIDEQQSEWDREYLLLELQNLWADFPEFNARERFAVRFPDFFDKEQPWETDKDVILEKANTHISKLEDIIAEQNRLLGNSEANLEIAKEIGFEPMIIDGLPTMVLDPLFPDRTVVYLTAGNEDITSLSMSDAVDNAVKSVVVYNDVTYSDYTDYISNMDMIGYTAENYDEGENEAVYDIDGVRYCVRFENEKIFVERDDINRIAAVPFWYMKAVFGSIDDKPKDESHAKATTVKKTPQINQSTSKKESEVKKDYVARNEAKPDKYKVADKDVEHICSLWDRAIGYFDKKIAVAEKISKYEKAYIDYPSAENLLNLQFMVHLGLDELEQAEAPSTDIDNETKDLLLSKVAYERAVKNSEFVDTAVNFAITDRKGLFNDFLWWNAYYKDTAHFLKDNHANETMVIEECKKYLAYTVYLVAQNFDEKQRGDFVSRMYQKYPDTLEAVKVDATGVSEDFRIHSLNVIEALYDEISKSNDNISGYINQHKGYLENMEEVYKNLGNDKECHTSPSLIDAAKTVPWVFGFTDAECMYILSDAARKKDYKDLVPGDVVSYSIIYPDKTYEDALEGIHRLEIKGVNVKEDIVNLQDQICRWNIDKNGKNIIYEWNKDKVTMSFPDSEMLIVPYGWYHYFGQI